MRQAAAYTGSPSLIGGLSPVSSQEESMIGENEGDGAPINFSDQSINRKFSTMYWNLINTNTDENFHDA